MKRFVAALVALLLSVTLFAHEGRSVALVLSGGGARGLAHLAILEAIEEEGIPIDLIVGTSIGAFVGAMYSVGYTPAEIRRIFFSLDLAGIFSEAVTAKSSALEKAFEPSRNHVFELRFSGTSIGRSPAIIGDQRILELLGLLFAKIPNPTDFDTLPIPFRAISADIIGGNEIIHDSGSLVRAVRSSISIPLVFAPFPLEDGVLAVDGGAVDNLPINVARALGADYVIASDLNTFVNNDSTQAESLSGVVMHSLTLVTQGAALAQHQAADLVIASDLHDVTPLDAFKLELAYQRGQEAVERSRVELQQLAKQIGSERELTPQNPDRIGSYTLKNDPIVKAVRLEDISLTKKELLFDENLFEFMVGEPLNDETVESFAIRLRQVRKQNALASLSFEMQEEGTLGILARSFGQSGNFIAMGFSADTGISNTLNGTYVYFKANAYLDGAIVNVGKSNLTYTLAASLGEQTAMNLGLAIPLGNHQVGASLGYATGSMTPFSSVVNAHRSPPLDHSLRSEFTYGYSLGQSAYIELAGRGDFFFINDYDKLFIAYPHVEVSFLYSTLSSNLAQEGLRVAALTQLGYLRDLTVAFRVQLHHHLRLSVFDTLGYSIELARLDGPPELISSYAEIGVPGYAPHTLKRDLIRGDIHYQRYLFDFFSYQSYLRLEVAAALFNTANPIVSPIQPREHFFEYEAFDLGFGAGWALQTPAGILALKVGVSILGSWSISIGVS